MRYVRRADVPKPAALSAADGPGVKELERARRHFSRRTNSASFTFKAYKDEEVVAALEALFHGKCAYCESNYTATAKVDVEHFRPKGGVLENRDHPGYWWLAAVWENLLPSCKDCNCAREQEIVGEGGVRSRRVSGKRHSFLTEDKVWVTAEGDISGEVPLLIDPTRDDPASFLRFEVDEKLPVVVPATRSGRRQKRAAETIRAVGLNRSGLVKARSKLLLKLQKKRADIVLALRQIKVHGDTDESVELLASLASEMRAAAAADEPYSALAKAYVAAFERELSALLPPS